MVSNLNEPKRSPPPPAKWGKLGDLLFCSVVMGGREMHSISFDGVLPEIIAESLVDRHPGALIEDFSVLELPEGFAWMAESRITSVSNNNGWVSVGLAPTV